MKKNILLAFIFFNLIISLQLLGESEYFPFSLREYNADLDKEREELEIFDQSNQDKKRVILLNKFSKNLKNYGKDSKVEWTIEEDFIKKSDVKESEANNVLEIMREYGNLPHRAPFLLREYISDLDREKEYLGIFDLGDKIVWEIVEDFIKQGGKKALEVNKAIVLMREHENLPHRSSSNETMFLDQAEEILKPLADQGVSYAQFWLGYLYEKDKKNYELAEKYYKLGADRGYLDHHMALGNLYKEQKKYDLAEKHLLFVFNDPVLHDGKIKILSRVLSDVSFELGELYYIQKKYDLSRKYENISFDIMTNH